MKHRIFIVLAISLLFELAPLQCHAQNPRQQKVRIADISARLFYDSDAKFSDNVFSGKVNLWNTVLEGASREGSSVSMLVVVEIEAIGDGSYPEGKQVELIARYRIEDKTVRGRPAYFRKAIPFYIRENQKAFAAFWLYETGCYPVSLRARIVGTKKTISRTINLGCGE
jgi:hypothetical protein